MTGAALVDFLRANVDKLPHIGRPVFYLSRRAWAHLARHDRRWMEIKRRIGAKLPRGPRLRSFGRSPSRMRRSVRMIESLADGLQGGLTSPPRPWHTLAVAQRVSQL